MKKIIVIVGPTAVGKTALSIELAQKFNGEVINADSMQVYQGLNIGTAKVTPEEAQGIKHHLLDICALDDAYSVARFQVDARQKIDEITARGKVPIIVGGTGLYVQSLIYDYQLGKKESDVQLGIRKKYEDFEREYGKQALWNLLKERDPLAAEAIHHNNVRKIIRALEVFEVTGKSILAPEKEPEKLYDDYLIGLSTERGLLYERINQRVYQMLDQGLLEEAKGLLETHPESPGALGIGYQEFKPYFAGQLSLESVIENIQLHSRRYAKRQLTWFRNRMAPHWFDLVQEPDQVKQIEIAVENWLKGEGIDE